MKIAMRVTLDIDAKVWASEYGLAHEDVRDDVRVYVRDLLQQGMVVTPDEVTVR